MSDQFQIDVQRDVEYGAVDGVRLLGDLYLPITDEPGPAMVLVHGGAMQVGSKDSFANWGRYLAGIGIRAFSIDYRLATEQPMFPDNVLDTKRAVHHLRRHADELGVDPSRIGVMGGSAGGYLAAMVMLTADQPDFQLVVDGEQVDTSIDVAVPIAGTFDMIAQWEHDLQHRSADHVKEKYLGGNPMEIRPTYYEASPIYHASFEHARGTKWLLVWGTDDDVVDTVRQALPMVVALKRANAMVRTVPLNGAPHFFYSEGSPDDPANYNHHIAHRLHIFLTQWAKWSWPQPTT